jgi:hypothetical protein
MLTVHLTIHIWLRKLLSVYFYCENNGERIRQHKTTCEIISHYCDIISHMAKFEANMSTTTQIKTK